MLASRSGPPARVPSLTAVLLASFDGLAQGVMYMPNPRDIIQSMNGLHDRA